MIDFETRLTPANVICAADCDTFGLCSSCSPLSQLSVPAIIMNICRTSAVSHRLHFLLENHSTYPNFEPLARLQVHFNNLAAIIVFLSWVKVRSRLNIWHAKTIFCCFIKIQPSCFSHSFLSLLISTRPWISCPPPCHAVPRTWWASLSCFSSCSWPTLSWRI